MERPAKRILWCKPPLVLRQRVPSVQKNPSLVASQFSSLSKRFIFGLDSRSAWQKELETTWKRHGNTRCTARIGISASRRGRLVEATSVSQQRACLCSSGYTVLTVLNCATLCYTVLHMAQEMTAQYLQNTFRTLQIFALFSSWMLLPIYIFSAFVRAISTTQQLFCPSNRFFLVDWMRAVTAFWNHDKETI